MCDKKRAVQRRGYHRSRLPPEPPHDDSRIAMECPVGPSRQGTDTVPENAGVRMQKTTPRTTVGLRRVAGAAGKCVQWHRHAGPTSSSSFGKSIAVCDRAPRRSRCDLVREEVVRENSTPAKVVE